MVDITTERASLSPARARVYIVPRISTAAKHPGAGDKQRYIPDSAISLDRSMKASGRSLIGKNQMLLSHDEAFSSLQCYMSASDIYLCRCVPGG